MALRRTLLRRTVAPAAAITAAVVLAACGSSDSSSSEHTGHDMGAMSTAGPSGTASAAQGGHNAQDVSFAQGMIPHHRQAVAMAGLAASRAKSQQVKDLAAKIEQAQDPEIDTMSGWLKAWDAKVPGTSPSGTEDMPGMDHSGSAMPGMMSSGDMAELKGLSGDAFDKAFLHMMISHHEGAIAMAKTERAKGSYGPATTMAKSIVTSQSSEITGMDEMLGN
ncbi:DUF305 domain-containing protein [Streptomyces populi]|uniref:DUF305 domain-containing protein n=1 Tax=Streptomyces populi TaxID=2058924 RepID=A0A2I0SLX9_9ACTN|nr:DUF305 domain-containing protein [Streptomyces populi]PKT70932.1 DUF305 domain-containing protein [Streptomyces populi]